MIVFDLRCSSDHVFEAWFASTPAFDEQRAGGLIACPVCGDTAVAKGVMAPNVGAKGNRGSGEVARADAFKVALAALASAQAKALETSEWVGVAFADKARAMHSGDETPAAIHGQTTPAEASALIEEGVPVMPLLVPVVPPEARN